MNRAQNVHWYYFIIYIYQIKIKPFLKQTDISNENLFLTMLSIFDLLQLYFFFRKVHESAEFKIKLMTHSQENYNNPSYH